MLRNEQSMFRNKLIRSARDAPASSGAKAPCTRCGGTPLGVEHLADVPTPQWVRCSRQLILHNFRAPRAVRLRPQLGVAERVRHAHHGVPPPREELFVAARWSDFHLVPRRCRPVQQPRFCPQGWQMAMRISGDRGGRMEALPSTRRRSSACRPRP